MALAFQSNAFENSAFEATSGGAVNYSLICAAGAYAVSGQAANLKQAHSLICSAGAYSLSGQAANLKQAHTLICSAGTYSVAGQMALLTYTSGASPAVNYSLICSVGVYSETGIAANLKVAHKLICAAGSYSTAGQASLLKVAHKLIAGSGSYALSGVSANLRVAHKLICSAGSYSELGQSVILRISHSLTCSAGAYTVTGQSANLFVTRSLQLSAGAYTVSGQSANVGVAHALLCAAGSYSLIGSTANLTHILGVGATSYHLPCNSGNYSLNGYAATLPLVRSLPCQTGSYTVTSFDATLVYDPFAKATNYRLICASGTYNVVEQGYIDPDYIEDYYDGNTQLRYVGTTTQYEWDTSQGVAKNAFVKFTPIQDIEAVVPEITGVFSVALVHPFAEASAPILGEVVYVSHHTPEKVKANGFAEFTTAGIWTYTAKVLPEAGSNADFAGHSGVVHMQAVQPTAGAAPELYAVAVTESTYGQVYPHGIRNPTDEELLVIIQTIRRRRAA